jgi:tRNA-Thr(GGU) m(6)t(6)A37 methyltransferase TsaA
MRMDAPPILLRPIGVVRSWRKDARSDVLSDAVAAIDLADDLPAESLVGLEHFSHAEIIYLFDRVAPESVVTGARHPRNNPAWPRVGIFAQRAAERPNRLGSAIVRVVGREGRRLRVVGLEAADGTPVLDIKPVMAECLPRDPVRQPDWARELMRHHWWQPTGRAG